MAEWDLARDHAGLQYQEEVTAEKILARELEIKESAWGEKGDVPEVSGAEFWDSASQKNINSWKQDGTLHEQINDTKEKPNEFRESPFKLTPSQKSKLCIFLNTISEAHNVAELYEVVNEALNLGVRINSAQGNKDTFTNEVISMADCLKGRKEEDAEIAGKLIYKLTSKGGFISHETCDLWALEEVFSDYGEGVEKAEQEFDRYFNKFKEIAKSAATQGKLQNSEIDNTTFYLEYSKNSIVDVAKVIDGAKSLGFNQGNIAFSGNIVKIGESEVEIEVKNGTRNYTDLSDDGDIILTFHTSLGGLGVRLYPDMQNKGRITVEVSDNDRKKINRLKNNEEIGKNCQLGGYSVYYAIKQGYFERSVNLQSFEVITLPKKVMEEAKKDLKHSDMKANSWTDKVQRSKVNGKGVQI